MTDLKKHVDPAKRHDFMLLFDVVDGNPNGDPDAGNLPRVDPETMHGLVTDVAIKRKIRDYVAQAREDVPKYNIYVESEAVLNEQHEKGWAGIGKDPKKDASRENIHAARSWMCGHFFDVRMFGAVMSTGINCGQVRGPVQLTFARSADPVTPLDVTITRVAVTKRDDKKKTNADGEEAREKMTEMGRKSLVPYGLYRGHGFITAKFARDTGATSEDLELLWEALGNMWELDRSASRGMLACRGVVIFTHENPLGNAHAHKLFEKIKLKKRDGVEAARTFEDYVVELPKQADMPEGVTLTVLHT
jgi:CRISPR-associated protein Csd2